ncbi:MAG TPA: homoserine kinase [bacterium]|nr:homoserine kinase [bacterium]
MIRLQVPASTANLGPGYDALALAVSVYNYIEVEPQPQGTPLEIVIEGEGRGELPQDESNLVFRAFKSAFQFIGMAVPDVRLKVVNKIPLARGLGSSAAAIVGGLLAAQQLLEEPLSQEQILELALQLEGHPDNISAALLGGLVIACRGNDKMHYTKIGFPKSLKLVLAVPDFQISTQEARKILPATLTREQAVFNLSRTALLTASFLTDDLTLLSLALEDKIHQPYRASLVPGLPTVFEAAKEAGALGVALSGAGPTVTAFAHHNLAAIQKAMEQAFKQHGVTAHTVITTPSLQGAKVL